MKVSSENLLAQVQEVQEKLYQMRKLPNPLWQMLSSRGGGKIIFQLDCFQTTLRWTSKLMMLLFSIIINKFLFIIYFQFVCRPRPVGGSKKGLQYKPEDHPYGLLPPPYHCGKWLRQRRVNFQLPYDLWWLHSHNKLPGRDTVPSWNYKKIRTSEWLHFDVRQLYFYS